VKFAGEMARLILNCDGVVLVTHELVDDVITIAVIPSERPPCENFPGLCLWDRGPTGTLQLLFVMSQAVRAQSTTT
jgi:hypothetical protein